MVTRKHIFVALYVHCLWITKATNTNSEYVIIIHFKWLHESTFLLRYTYIACLFSCWYFSLHSNDKAFPNTNNEFYPYDQFTVILNILEN